MDLMEQLLLVLPNRGTDVCYMNQFIKFLCQMNINTNCIIVLFTLHIAKPIRVFISSHIIPFPQLTNGNNRIKRVNLVATFPMKILPISAKAQLRLNWAEA